MGKSRHSKYNYRMMDREYSDGDEQRQEYKNKSKDRRFERALKTRNVDDLIEEEYEYDVYNNQNQVWSR